MTRADPTIYWIVRYATLLARCPALFDGERCVLRDGPPSPCRYRKVEFWLHHERSA